MRVSRATTSSTSRAFLASPTTARSARLPTTTIGTGAPCTSSVAFPKASDRTSPSRWVCASASTRRACATAGSHGARPSCRSTATQPRSVGSLPRRWPSSRIPRRRFERSRRGAAITCGRWIRIGAPRCAHRSPRHGRSSMRSRRPTVSACTPTPRHVSRQTQLRSTTRSSSATVPCASTGCTMRSACPRVRSTSRTAGWAAWAWGSARRSARRRPRREEASCASPATGPPASRSGSSRRWCATASRSWSS